MEESKNVKSPKRLKRVKRLKKIIVGSVITFIFMPTALAVFFGCKAYMLSKELMKANMELNYYLELQSEAEFEKQDIYVEPIETLAEDASVEESNPQKEQVHTELNQSEIDKLTLSTEDLYYGYRKVYLTFDDGPSSNTSNILDILNEYGVKATFFVVRREGSNFEKLYQRIVDEGHSLGMHSNTHVYKDLYKDLESFTTDTESLRNFLYMVTGAESDIYRFPGGSSNRVSPTDMHVFADALEKEGIVFFDWNVSSQDASAVKQSREQIVKNVTSKIEQYDESIVLFHDLGSKETTVEALPEIIEYIQSLDNTVILPITRETNQIRHLSRNE